MSTSRSDDIAVCRNVGRLPLALYNVKGVAKEVMHSFLYLSSVFTSPKEAST